MTYAEYCKAILDWNARLAASIVTQSQFTLGTATLTAAFDRNPEKNTSDKPCRACTYCVAKANDRIPVLPPNARVE